MNRKRSKAWILEQDPAVKKATDWIRRGRRMLKTDLTYMMNLGKLSPEARPFIARRLRQLATECYRIADELSK